MKRALILIALLCVVLDLTASVLTAEGVRLFGITGNQGLANDETLYEIDVNLGTVTPLLKLPFVPDTDAIGFNSQNGLLYRTSGADSYSNDRTSNGFRDNHFMESIDVLSGSLVQAAVFNANAEQFGLAAPRPTWVLPSERRADDETGGEFRIQGPNEYHSLRDFTWSRSECLFYGADEDGIFTLTAAGESKFVAHPGGQPKGITFATVGGERRLYLSDRNSSELWTIDPTTGQHIGSPVMVKDPVIPSAFVFGLLSLDEIPGEPLLYAIQNTPGNPTGCHLLIIDPLTGDSVSVMPFGVHMADLAVVYDPLFGDINLDNQVNRLDAALFARSFGISVGATWTTGDFDCDGAATVADLALLQSHLGQPIAAEVSSAAVPEPDSGMLTLLFVTWALTAGIQKHVRSTDSEN